MRHTARDHPVTIYGIDVHPQFQAGLNIEQVRAEGFDFMAVKVSQGTTTYPGIDWLHRGTACGLLSIGYHYLDDGNPDGQARTFAGQLAVAGVPGMLDIEQGSGDINNVRAFLNACQVHGADVRLLYFPHWYWQDHIGSPDLTGLPPLWASSYVGGSGYASNLYTGVSDSHWTGYGGGNVEILQFTDQALVAGQRIDADAYRGTREQLAALIGGAPSPPPVPSPPLPHPGPDSIPTMTFGQTSQAIAHLQDWCNRMFPAYARLPVTGYYGPMTRSVIAEFQHRVGIEGTGDRVGPLTADALWTLGYRP